jgi:hypothetical protein
MGDQIFSTLLSSFDFGYMLAVNVLTYLTIKLIDELNGTKIVPVWLKRIIAVICGIIIGTIIVIFNGYSNSIIYSFYIKSS